MVTSIAMMLLDFCILSITYILTVLCRYLLGGIFTHDKLTFYIQLYPLLVIFIIVFLWFGLYPGLFLAKSEELKRLSVGSTFVVSILVTISFFSKDVEEVSRFIILIWWGFLLIALPLGRSIFRRYMRNCPWWGISAVIFGPPEANAKLIELFSANPSMGIRVRAVVPVSMAKDSFDDVRQKLFIYAYIKPKPVLICSLSLSKMSLTVRETLISLENHFRKMFLLPPNALSTLRLEVVDLGGVLFLCTSTNLLDPVRQKIKRSIDLLLIVIFSPLWGALMLLLALGIKAESSGKVFYKQARVGRHNKTFYIYKFRTMRPGAEKVLQQYLRENPELRQEWEEKHKLCHDPRVTGIGKFLRKTSLDELPQIWNVLKGEMSLVGPRPIVEDEINRYAEAYDLYQRTWPGITGFWQISGRNDTSYERRVAMDVYYSRNWSVWVDIYILIKTIGVVLRCKGAY